jgi:transposase
VLAAVELGINNGRLEALNSNVRSLSHRAYGFHSADALIATIYLCRSGIQIPLPHRWVTPNGRGEPNNVSGAPVPQSLAWGRGARWP